MTTNEFGHRVRTLRIEKCLMQYQLAKLAGIDKWTMTHYERGTREPSTRTLLRLARALDSTPNYLLGWTARRKYEHQG